MSETVSAKWHSWRTPLTVAAIIAIAGGTPVAVWAWPPHDSASAIARFIYGNGAQLPGVSSRVRDALCTEAWFIAGYGLALGGCAVIFWVWAISKFGQLAAIYALASVGIAVVAGVVEVWLLGVAVDRQDPHSLIAII